MTSNRPVRAFVDRPVSDIDAARRAARRAADHWRLGEPVLLRIGMNAIFTSADVVLRVSAPTAPASASIELAGFLSSHGVNVPAPARDDVVVDGPVNVTAWTMIPATGERVDWTAVGRMVRRVHGIDRVDVPRLVPLPRPEDFPWWGFDALMERAADGLDDGARGGLRAAIDRRRGWHDDGGRVVCHGDVHPGNVIMSVDGPVLIDWDLLCWGPAGWDHGPMMTWAECWGGSDDEYESFADGYGQSLRGDPTAEAIAELRLVAATLMRVIAGLSDPGAMPEAQRRLRYWRGDPDAPAWVAQ